MVCLVLLGWLANLDPLESLVLPVFRDALERLDHQVSLEPRATVVSLVFKVFQGLLDPKDKRDLQEKMERTGSQARPPLSWRHAAAWQRGHTATLP